MTPTKFMAQLAIQAALLFGRAARHLRRCPGPTVLNRLASRDPHAGQVDFKPEPMTIDLKVSMLD